MFTVPCGGGGLYYFHVHLTGQVLERSEFFLKKNDVTLCSMEPDGDSSGENDNPASSCAATVELNTGKTQLHFPQVRLQWRIKDFPLGGGGGGRRPIGGGANPRCIHFLTKMYAKTKEIDPVGGARAGGTPLDPPMV